MSLQAQMTGSDALQVLLESAEQRKQQSGENPNFAVCLLDETISVCGLSSASVWEQRGATSLLWSRGAVSDNPAGDALAREARMGIVRTTRVDVAGSRSPGWVSTIAAEVCDAVRLVLEVRGVTRHPAGQGPAAPDLADGLLRDLAEVFADLRRREMLSRLLGQSERERRLHHVIALLHADLDESRVVNTIASDLPELLGCARVSVVRRAGRRRWEVLAATAVSAPDPRSDAVRRIRRLAEEAAAGLNPQGITGLQQGATPEGSSGRTDSEPLSALDSAAERDFVAESVRSDARHPVLVRPLSLSGTWDICNWAAVLEFDGAASDAGDPRLLQRVCQHATLALANCSARSQATLTGRLRKLPRQFLRPGIAVCLGGLLLTAAFLAWHRTELRIEVAGRLVPGSRMYVFAPDDGVISQVLVDDGSEVVVGSSLCQLKNEDLEIQYESTEGELAAAQARLAAIESMRGDRNLAQNGNLSVEQAELTERIASIQKQSEILAGRIENLNVRAARSGRIYGERPRELLTGRPVRRGQYLFEVADPQGDWELALDIDETDVRHVTAAMTASTHPLPVSFALQTAPDQSLRTTLAHLAHSVQIDERGGLSTRATAPFTVTEPGIHRPGAGVVAYVHCGQRSVGYVLFRRPVEFIQQRWRSGRFW